MANNIIYDTQRHPYATSDTERPLLHSDAADLSSVHETHLPPSLLQVVSTKEESPSALLTGAGYMSAFKTQDVLK